MNTIVQRGFTLIEVVTVMVILAIVAAFAAPRFADDNLARQRGYVDELTSAIRLAQRVAISSACDVQFSLDAAGYRAVQRAPAGNTCSLAGAWNTPVLRSDGLAVTGATPQGVAVVANWNLVFSGQLGEPSLVPPPATVGTYSISLAPRTGLVTVQP